MIRRFLLVLAVLSVATILAVTSTNAGPLFSEGHEPGSVKDDQDESEEILPDVSNLTPYSRVGVLQFEQLVRNESSARKFLSILIGRLDNKCENTEFVELEVELDEDTPLMGDTARELGEEYDLDAIVVGSYAVNVVGGIYPSKTNNTPVGTVSIECRVIDCESGWSRGKVLMTWEKNKIYSSTIRSQKDLEGRLMRDGIDDMIAMLLDRGFLSFEPEPVVADEGTTPEEGADTESTETGTGESNG